MKPHGQQDIAIDTDRSHASTSPARWGLDRRPARVAYRAICISLLAGAFVGGQPVTAQTDDYVYDQAPVAAVYSPQRTHTRYAPALSYGNDLTAQPPADRRVAYSNGSISGQGAPMRIRRDPSGSFVANVLMNGVPVRVIIDTGAQCTILSLQDARQTGADRDVTRSATMAGIGGYTQLNVTRVRSMNVGGQQLGGFNAVIGQAGIPYTLLGQSEIARLGRIVIEDGVMTISPR